MPPLALASRPKASAMTAPSSESQAGSRAPGAGRETSHWQCSRAAEMTSRLTSTAGRAP